MPEDELSPLRWLAVDEARVLAEGNNLSYTLDRVKVLLR